MFVTYSCFKGEYLKTPKLELEWLEVARGFQDRWNFPNCLGAVDGKHVAIIKPPKSGSTFFNYKGFHSIILMAVLNSNYEVLYADVGANGRASDGGVWSTSSLVTKINNNTIGIPPPSQLPNSDRVLPHVFVGDAAYPLKTYLMKPYPHKEQAACQRIYSYRVSRARRIIENVFGLLHKRFGVLRTTINLPPGKVKTIVLAIITLHNILRKLASDVYIRDELPQPESRESSTVVAGEDSRISCGYGRRHLRNSSA